MPRSRSSGALSIWSNATVCARPFFAWIAVIAAVRVVLPWSTWPMVPTFTCGFVRSNLFFATGVLLLFQYSLPAIYVTRPRPLATGRGLAGDEGAHEQDRTADLILTKNVLYRLSYVGLVG